MLGGFLFLGALLEVLKESIIKYAIHEPSFLTSPLFEESVGRLGNLNGSHACKVTPKCKTLSREICIYFQESGFYSEENWRELGAIDFAVKNGSPFVDGH